MLIKKHFTHTARMGRILVILMVISTLILSGCGPAKQVKIYKVGVLSGLDAFAAVTDGFKSKMTTLGYIEGQNISYDVQKTNVDVAAYQRITKKFVEDKVDLILAFPSEAAMRAKTAAQDTNIPVVFAMAYTDVKGLDLVKSIREPGGNITGVRFPSAADIVSKRLQVLLEMAPNAKRIFVAYLKGYSNIPGQLDAIRALTAAQGIQLIELAATTPEEIQAKLDSLSTPNDAGIDAILMLGEPLGDNPILYGVLGRFSYAHKIPIGGALTNVDGNYGSIFSVLPDPKTAGEQAALLAHKIFGGTPAGTIPVITSENYFQIDYKAAQALNVTVPEGLLKQADKIIR